MSTFPVFWQDVYTAENILDGEEFKREILQTLLADAGSGERAWARPEALRSCLRLAYSRESGHAALIWCAVIGLFRSRASLEAEILVLRHQLDVLRRKSPKRLVFGKSGFCWPLLDCAAHCECLGDRAAGDGDPLASRRVSFVLAMEVAISRRQAEGGDSKSGN